MEKRLTLLELHLHDAVRVGPTLGSGSGDDAEDDWDDDADDDVTDGADGGPPLKALVALVLLVALAVAARKLLGGEEADLEGLQTLDEFADEEG